jgi:hypothetical protein
MEIKYKPNEVELAEGLGMSIAEFRAKKAIMRDEKINELIEEATSLKDRGYSITHISGLLGMSESTVRTLLNPFGIKFELGKCYRHSAGSEVRIIGIGDSTIFGLGLVAEDNKGNFSIFGMTEEHAVNWEEITYQEWMKNFNA